VGVVYCQVSKLGSLAFQGITLDSDDEVDSLGDSDDDDDSNEEEDYVFGVTSGSKLMDKYVLYAP